MTKKRARNPRRRSLLENVFDDVSDLFQDLKQELHTPSEREQMWEVIDKRLGEVEGAVRGIQEQGSLDRQAVLDALTQFVDRLDTVEQSLKPEEISRWKALLSPLKKGVRSFIGGAKRSKNQVFWWCNPLSKPNPNWEWGAGPEDFSKTWFFQGSHCCID